MGEGLYAQLSRGRTSSNGASEPRNVAEKGGRESEPERGSANKPREPPHLTHRRVVPGRERRGLPEQPGHRCIDRRIRDQSTTPLGTKNCSNESPS